MDWGSVVPESALNVHSPTLLLEPRGNTGKEDEECHRVRTKAFSASKGTTTTKTPNLVLYEHLRFRQSCPGLSTY